MLKFITVPAIAKHTSTVIFVHGLGDTGNGWKPVADMFRQDPGLSHVKWILPHSPTRAVTANMGMSMPSWFDIYSFGFDTAEDEEGMVRTVGQLNEFIRAEVEGGIDASRIVLGGFSQGGAMSLLTGLTSAYQLGGIVVLSGWLPLRHKIGSMMSAHATSVDVFWGHGRADPLVKYEFGLQSAAFVRGLGVSVDMRTYEGMGHSACDEELLEVARFVKLKVSIVGE